MMRSMPKLPASEAAPETLWVRRLRFGWIALATATAAGTMSFSALVALDRTIAGVGMFVLLALTIVVGIFYFRLKVRRDDAWADATLARDRSTLHASSATLDVSR